MQHQDSKETYLGWVLSLLTVDEEIFIPFFCRKCGKCCREVSIDPHYFNPFEIADYLGLPVQDVVKTYLGEITHLDDDQVDWKQTKPMKPCTFLEDDKCKIYPIRPGPCTSFPISTDFGDSRIGCPGREEYVRARKILGRGIPYFSKPYQKEAPPEVHIQRKRWKKTIDKYLSARPCDKSIKIFHQVNSPKS